MAVIDPPRRVIHSPLQQDTVAFLETAAETGRTLLEVDLAPGGGNAPHVHRTYDEYFEVVQGFLTVRLGDQTHELRPGEMAVAPAGMVHAFRNESTEPVRFRCEIRPGHRGFEKALQAGYGLAAAGRVHANGAPKSFYELAVLIEWSEMEIAGPMRMLSPVFGRLARKARERGIDRLLEELYCRY